MVKGRKWFSLDRRHLGVIFALSWPTMLEFALQTIVQYVDSAMVGQTGALATAAVGLTASVGWLISAPMSAMGIGVLAFIARSLGAKEEEDARIASVQSVFLVLILGLILGAATLAISPYLPGWLGANPAIWADATAYFSIICMPMVFRAAIIVFGSVLRAAGDMKTPLVAGVATNVINIALNWLLIYPVRQATLFGRQITLWGAGLGVQGAAIATAIAYVVGGTLITIFVYKHKKISFRGQKLRIYPKVMGACVRVGIPVMLQRVCVNSGHVMFTSLVASLDAVTEGVALAAHSLAITAEQAFYIPGYGLQAAASTLSGNALGEGDLRKVDQIGFSVIWMTVALMTITGAILFAFPEQVMGIFIKDPRVQATGVQLLRIVAISEPVFGLLIILEGIFNGLGDTRAPVVYSVLSMWVVRNLCTWLMINAFGLGLNAAWWCMAADNGLRATLLLVRFIRGSWKKRVAMYADITRVPSVDSGV